MPKCKVYLLLLNRGRLAVPPEFMEQVTSLPSPPLHPFSSFPSPPFHYPTLFSALPFLCPPRRSPGDLEILCTYMPQMVSPECCCGFFIVHNNVPAKFITTQSLVGAWVKATGNSRSEFSWNSRESTTSKIPGRNSRELLSSWLRISGSFGILDFLLFLVVNCL